MADTDLSGISIHKMNKFSRKYLMADITKCANWHGCPKAEDCYRHTAPDNQFWAQSYGDFHPEAPWLCFYKRGTEQKETLKK